MISSFDVIFTKPEVSKILGWKSNVLKLQSVNKKPSEGIVTTETVVLSKKVFVIGSEFWVSPFIMMVPEFSGLTLNSTSW